MPSNPDLPVSTRANRAVQTAMRSRADDEIDLFELVGGVWRQKAWVIGFALFAVLVAGAWVAFTPPVYESRAAIDIGRMPPTAESRDSQLIEPPQRLSQRLREAYGLNALSGPPALPRLEAVEWDSRNSGSVIILRARAASPGQAQFYLNTVVAGLAEEHGALYQTLLDLRALHFERLQASHDELERQAEAFERVLDALRLLDPVQASLLAVESSTLAAQLTALEQRMERIELAALPPVSEPTRVLSEPDLRESPAEPRVFRILAIALVLGLMFGVGVGLLRETLAKRRAAFELGEVNDG